ncbi:MAG: DUF1801 domain-containing protein [Solimonas sp.]
MAQNKTRPGRASVEGFLAKIKDEERRKDCAKVLGIMKTASGEKPRMWGSMIGFGEYHYRYASGQEGDCFQMGFASRKPDLTLYVLSGPERHAALLAKLGKHKLGKCCLYIRRLADVDMGVLQKLIDAAARQIRSKAG